MKQFFMIVFILTSESGEEREWITHRNMDVHQCVGKLYKEREAIQLVRQKHPEINARVECRPQLSM